MICCLSIPQAVIPYRMGSGIAPGLFYKEPAHMMTPSSTQGFVCGLTAQQRVPDLLGHLKGSFRGGWLRQGVQGEGHIDALVCLVIQIIRLCTLICKN